MATISKKTKNALSCLLGDYEDFGFTLAVGKGCIELYFKESLVRQFPANNDSPLTGFEVQAECGEYVNKLNAQFN